ncbi:MAG: hybrid sensor histidine kinase/response regulator [Phycisphaerae bacterium]|jgi:signal transduction histidine kinase/DNA-binding response OmpR family regulator|nr:hybrid sensor histidine kinase/response regulator [Phycisphaerae bacterium]
MATTYGYARFVSVEQEYVKLETLHGKTTVFLAREEIAFRTESNAVGAEKVSRYFEEHPFLFVRWDSDPAQAGLRQATLKTIVADVNLRKLLELSPGMPVQMIVRDTNSKEFAYGDISENMEGRCAKQALRDWVKMHQPAPPKSHHPRNPSKTDKLADANPEGADLAQGYYAQYELHPGDRIIGCLVDAQYDTQEHAVTVELSIPEYMDLLERDPVDAFRQLGLSGAEQSEAVATITDGSHDSIPEPGGKPMCVLVLDNDINSVLKPFSKILEGDGHTTVCAWSIAQARRKLAELARADEPMPYDLAILDIHLQDTPGCLDYMGVEFAKELQAVLPECRIALMSATDQYDNKLPEFCGDLEIVSFLRKPVTSRQLRRVVNQLYDVPRQSARTLFAGAGTKKKNSQIRSEKVRRDAEKDLQKLASELRCKVHAETVVLFRMHKLSRDVSILVQDGAELPRFSQYRPGLRYSPVRDVVETGESWCHSNVMGDWRLRGKHKNLLRIFKPEAQYTCCAAAPVPAPPGDEYAYAFFAFRFPAVGRSVPAAFDVTGLDTEDMPEEQGELHQNVAALGHVREYASHAGMLLFKEWHFRMQIKQAPFLLMGIAMSGMGHDLANLLMGSNQNVVALQQDMESGTPATSENIDQLVELERFTERAIDIARRFGSTARANEESVTGFSVADAIREGCFMARREAARYKVGIYLDNCADVSVRSQRGILERAVFNLVLNAIQQIGLHPWREGLVQVQHKLTKGGELIIRIYDNGPGIAGYRLERIFEPGETKRSDGCGMGLAIVRSILSNIAKVTINVRRSILFCGTCFEISIPARFVSPGTDREM